MSLINDALKRAREAQTENPTPPPDLPLRAAESSPRRNFGLPLLPLAALLVALALGGALVFMALQKQNAAPQVVHAAQADTTSAAIPSPAATTPPITTSAAPTTTAPAPDVRSTASAPVATQTQSPVATPVIDSPSGSTPDAPAAASNPEPPKPAVPKLQGIFYNPSRPSAVMNGKTVYVGSRVGEARDFLVLAISRESVTVGNRSQTNVLVLAE
jgi:cytoskeletal protein RodZ